MMIHGRQMALRNRTNETFAGVNGSYQQQERQQGSHTICAQSQLNIGDLNFNQMMMGCRSRGFYCCYLVGPSRQNRPESTKRTLNMFLQITRVVVEECSC